MHQSHQIPIPHFCMIGGEDLFVAMLTEETRPWMSVLFPSKSKTGTRPEGREGYVSSCQAAEPRAGKGGRAAKGQHEAFALGWPGPITEENRSPPHSQNTRQTAKVGREGNNKIQSRDNRNTLQRSIKTLVSPGDTNPQETRLHVSISMHITEITSNCSKKIL